ncbi:MAG: DUF975 family protein [Clostridiales bacterium]|nr:DUF975 family protein [Clostridiales bacterium]
MRQNNELRRFARQQMRGNFDVLFGILMLFLVMEWTASFIAGFVPLLPLAVTVIITPAFALSQAFVFIKTVRGSRPLARDAFYGFKGFWAAFKTTWLTALYVFLWSLLLIVPGIIKAISYSQALNIVADNPDIGARDAISRSKELMEGKKMQYFLLGLSFFGWIVLSVFTLGLLLIWVVPYMITAQAVFYCELIADEEQQASAQVNAWGNGYFSYMYNRTGNPPTANGNASENPFKAPAHPGEPTAENPFAPPAYPTEPQPAPTEGNDGNNEGNAESEFPPPEDPF